jgi:hypothetical protein
MVAANREKSNCGVRDIMELRNYLTQCLVSYTKASGGECFPSKGLTEVLVQLKNEAGVLVTVTSDDL